MPGGVPQTVHGKVRAQCQRSGEKSHDLLMNAGWNIIPKHWQSEPEASLLWQLLVLKEEPLLVIALVSVPRNGAFELCSSF